MFALSQYVGLKLEEASLQARQAGFEVAVERPGIQRLNCEFRQGRITFQVDHNNVVLAAQNG